VKRRILNPKIHTNAFGFTLIELMIILATIVIVMTLAVPTYSNYWIRAKTIESLYSVTELKSAAVDFCREGRSKTPLDNELIGYKIKDSKYVQEIVLSGTCNEAVIVITTKATGAKPDPVLTMTGNFSKDSEQFTWNCVSSGPNVHTPGACQS